MKGESFEVKSPLSVSGVLGTEFEVSYINDESEIKVVEGKVNTKDKRTGQEVILEKERMARIRRDMKMEVKKFKLKELKKWHEWKKGHLDFLLRKIEEALSQGRGMQASRLIVQGYILARRLNLYDEYERKIDQLKKKYENLKEKQGIIEKRIKEFGVPRQAYESAAAGSGSGRALLGANPAVIPRGQEHHQPQQRRSLPDSGGSTRSIQTLSRCSEHDPVTLDVVIPASRQGDGQEAAGRHGRMRPGGNGSYPQRQRGDGDSPVRSRFRAGR